MKDKRIYGMFGPKIKAMRLEHGLKQRQLAELLGTDMPMYSKMELGARRVKRDLVPRLAELYKVDEKELMTLWLADGVYAFLKEEDENLRLDAIDLAKEYFSGEWSSVEWTLPAHSYLDFSPSLAEKLVDILHFVADKEEITTENIVAHFGFTVTFAKRYLRQLTEFGYLEDHGGNKNRTYSKRVNQ